jgi:hypothetical protein
MLDGVSATEFDARCVVGAGARETATQIRAKVVGAVVFVWIKRWVTAREGGDPAAMDQSVAVDGDLHTGRSCREVQSLGDYPAVL